VIERYQKGHVNGFVPLRSGNMVHLMIPKCGTNTVAEVLQHRNGWERFREKMFDEEWEYTAIVRHPVDRWVSGAMQYEQGGQQRRHGSVDNAIKKMVFDCHTAPQYLWLMGFDGHVNLKLFKLEHIKRLWEHLGITNWRGVHKQKRIYFPGRSKLVLEEKHEERIMDHYAEDMRLYERAE
tara:strand:- start:5896 stop:6435 length:540 start_codon:yes stop_codon:yes gene_type:complete